MARPCDLNNRPGLIIPITGMATTQHLMMAFSLKHRSLAREGLDRGYSIVDKALEVKVREVKYMAFYLQHVPWAAWHVYGVEARDEDKARVHRRRINAAPVY